MSGSPAVDDQPFTLSVWSDARPAVGDTDYQRRFDELVEEAKLADRLGFRSFWGSEVHGVEDGYLGAQLPLLAGLATVTEHLRLVTAIIVLPLYRWRQAVEGAVVVDLLSEGRLELGVAVGAYEREFRLFGVDMRRRGRLLEEGLGFIRQGLHQGEIPDGPNGKLVPVTPRPSQAHVPILLGGMSAPAVTRAARLGDGTIAYDFERPEENLPTYWTEVLGPALEQASRTLADFRFLAGVPLWVSDDPEREWNEVYRPALQYQERKYSEWYDSDGSGAEAAPQPQIEDHFVGTPEEIAARLVETWRRAPWHDLGFFYRLPGVSHEQALEQLELVQNRLMPAVRRLAAGEGGDDSDSVR